MHFNWIAWAIATYVCAGIVFLIQTIPSKASGKDIWEWFIGESFAWSLLATLFALVLWLPIFVSGAIDDIKYAKRMKEYDRE